MNPVSQHASTFRKSLRELKLLDDREIEEILDQSQQTGVSPIEILVRKGLVNSSDIDVIDLLVRADEAIPGYELISLIGRGGMGVVYRARQKTLNRIVALKTVLANKATDKLALARFEREAVTIAQLSHPNIVNPLDFGQHDGRLYLAMELVEGEDLEEYIQQRGQLPEWVAWGIARQVAAGLLHASRAGVIHRDIKPANILLVKPPEGHALRPGLPMAKISDFGLAILNSQQAVSTRLTSEDSKIGSPNYMAPEQLEGGPCDTRVDIYALGATVFHILVGHPPWSGKSLQQIVTAKIQKTRISMADYRQDLSAESLALLANMMDPEVERRSHNYEQLMAAMASLSEAFGPNIPIRHAAVSTETVSEMATLEMATLESPVGKSELPRGKSSKLRKVWFGAGISTLVIVAAAGTAWMLVHPARSQLVATSDQVRLFDGQNLFSPELTQMGGGWLARDGRLIHAVGTLGALTFHLPDWENFVFEAIVENAAMNSITVQFSASQSEGAGQRKALQLADGHARLGSLPDWRSELVPISKEIQLDAERPAHALRVQRNENNWVATVDEIEIGSLRLTAHSLPEITVVVRKLKPRDSASKETDSESENCAFSEVVVTRLASKT